MFHVGGTLWLLAEAEANPLWRKVSRYRYEDSHWLIPSNELTIRDHQHRRRLATMSENQKKQRITDLDAIEPWIFRSYIQYRKVMYELKINKQVIIKENQTDF